MHTNITSVLVFLEVSYKLFEKMIIDIDTGRLYNSKKVSKRSKIYQDGSCCDDKIQDSILTRF